MPLTKEEHTDLTLRLEVLVGEYAAASQRTEAVAKLQTVLERVAPEAEADAELAAPEATDTPAEPEPPAAPDPSAPE